jgi:hypothetical protein
MTFLFLATILATLDTTTTGWLEILKGYGLGILTLGYFIFYLQGELKEARIREKEAEKNILELTRESLQSINNLSKVVEQLSPAIGSLSGTHRQIVEDATKELTGHINLILSRIELMIKEASRNKSSNDEENS